MRLARRATGPSGRRRRHSEADIGKAARLLGYSPTHDIGAGIEEALPWYLAHGGGNPD
jgi:UDP-N-acetylglucosamine 4-epimerase